MRRHRTLISAILGIGLLGVVAAFAVAIVPRAAKASPQTLTVCLAGSPTCQYGSINDALAAANAGDTISVAAGTYTPTSETHATTTDAAITVNKAVTIQGAGVGQTILNVASAYTGTASNGGVIRISNPGGDVSISGFTFEGSNVNDPNGDGIFIFVHDTAGASDTITISHNLFYSDTTIDPNLVYDQIDAIYVASTVATTTITDNTFQGIFRAALIEGNPGPTNFRGNVLTELHGQQDHSDPTILYVAEGVFYLMDNNVDVTTPQINENNLFENFGGLGIAVGAGYSGPLMGTGSNYTISHNTFNLQQVLGNTGSPFESPAIVVKSYNASSTITDTTISDNVFNLTSPTGHGYAIWLNGGLGSGIAITHNAMLGSGSGSARPLAGININGSIATSNIAINNNTITGFQNGIFADSLATGATVGGSQNCIYSNSSSGATNSTGATISAANNWWGAASGPTNASNPGGTGNAVSDNITFQPFLAKGAAACTGPVVTNLKLNPNPAATGQGYAITATATGGFNIASATYTVDGGTAHAMSASDGAFDATAEGLKASGASFASPGTHTICVTATDIAGNVSAPACTALRVLTQAGLDGLGHTPAPPTINPPSGNSNSSTTKPTNPLANAQSNNAPLIKMAPRSSASASLPTLPIALFAGVLLLCGLGAVAFVITRKRALGQP